MGQNNDKILRVIDLALAGLGIIPSTILAVQELVGLRARAAAGEDVTLEELDAKLARMQERSARIQAA